MTNPDRRCHATETALAAVCVGLPVVVVCASVAMILEAM